MSKHGLVDKTRILVIKKGILTESGHPEIIASFQSRGDANIFVDRIGNERNYIIESKSKFHL